MSASLLVVSVKDEIDDAGVGSPWTEESSVSELATGKDATAEGCDSS